MQGWIFFPLTGALTVFSDYDISNVNRQMCFGRFNNNAITINTKNKIKNFVEGSQ